MVISKSNKKGNFFEHTFISKNYDHLHFTAPISKIYSSRGCREKLNTTKNACLLKGQGYVSVFVSNEIVRFAYTIKKSIQSHGQSQGSVYFDDLTVTHTPGPLLEEHHYYPTGLEMFALSSSGGNGHVRNRYTYQGQERGSTVGSPPGGGLGGYEFEARHYDPQIGRWMVPDPANQFASPYVGMGNEWVSGV